MPGVFAGDTSIHDALGCLVPLSFLSLTPAL